MKSPLEPARNHHPPIVSAGVILLVTAIGSLLAFQGWNTRLMNFDHVNFIDAASQLVTKGVLPDRGDVSSYWAYATPGPAWLMAPGMFFFNDPRLYEAIGSVALYLGTLLGVFLLARKCFGLECAYLSVVLYGLSRNGLFNAGSLWSIGHPFFYVWMVYFSLLWVRRNNPNYLAAAGLAWSIGMYVDMVLAPAMFVIPAIWLLYRPRVRVIPVLVTIVLTLLVWYPFLRFERTRGFVDLKALVARQPLRPPDYKIAWCVPNLTVRSLHAPAAASSEELRVASLQVADFGPTPPDRPRQEAVKRQMRDKATVFKEALTFNFDQMTWSPWAAVPLLLLALVTLTVVALLSRAGSIVTTVSGRQLIRAVGWTALLLAVLANEWLVARFLSTNGSLIQSTIWYLRTLQAGLTLTALALLLWTRQIVELRSQLECHSDERRDAGRPAFSTLFAVALLAPWAVLTMVVESGYSVRYFWLWPLQTILVVAAVTYVPDRLGWSRSVARLGQVSLILLMLSHPWLISPLQTWVASGWSGPMAGDLQAVDYIAHQLRSEGRDTAAIGYQTFMVEFMAAMHVVDPRYKVGAELDLFLKQRHGISNLDQCAEGVSAGDEYRIVQRAPTNREVKTMPASWEPIGGEVKTYTLDQFVDITLNPSFRKLQEFGDFQVFRRADAPLSVRPSGTRREGGSSRSDVRLVSVR